MHGGLVPLTPALLKGQKCNMFYRRILEKFQGANHFNLTNFSMNIIVVYIRKSTDVEYRINQLKEKKPMIISKDTIKIPNIRQYPFNSMYTHFLRS